MARPRKVEVSAINVRVHTRHSPDEYISLFKAAYELDKAVRVHGDQYLLLANMGSRDEKGDDNLYGWLAKFTDIDFGARWFNIEKHKPADPEDLSAVRIPKELRPNFASFRFVLFPKEHIFAFETFSEGKTLSPNAVETLLQELFQMRGLNNRYGEVDLTIVPTTDSIANILKIKTLRKLSLRIRRPNDLSGERKRVFNRMNTQNIGEWNQTFVAADDKSIAPSEEVKTMAHIAADNGVVQGIGKDEKNRRVEESTQAHPLKVTEPYSPDVEDKREAFMRAASKLLGIFKKRQN